MTNKANEEQNRKDEDYKKADKIIKINGKLFYAVIDEIVNMTQ